MVTQRNFPAEPGGSELRDIYRRVMLIKLTDERIRRVIRSGRIMTPHYSPRGQEVIPSAICAQLNPDDYYVTIYRGLHDHLAKGVPLKQLWAEYAGRATGSCKGKGGPMHITHPAAGVVVTTGIVGSGIPIANGLAWASQLKGDGRITVTNFGDGASNIGAFHEGLNLASLWKLPVIFVCQNNRFGEHTTYEKATAVAEVAMRAASYSMPSIRVDGNDPVAMWKAAHEAIERARSGGGPTLIEAMTFRFEGHTNGDDSSYIPAEMMAEFKAKDPVPLFRKFLLDAGHATDADLDAVEAQITAEIDEAVDFALNSPWPELDELNRDIYLEEIEA
jgi:Pyruvate/2-oxoglutarate dehydrogenase complex, dehydrogenase (E1) component, eukaryotic type, alpha subunit